jgi:poly(3-hydroxybutyrate) depolymerase
MQIKGEVKFIRDAIEKLQNTKDVDRIEFIVAPIREEGCC